MLGDRSSPAPGELAAAAARADDPPGRGAPASRAHAPLPRAAAPGRLIDHLLDPRRLQSRFGLTPAEARVAIALAAGDSRADRAQRLGVQLNTVHAHLKQVLAKTGCRRQTQLVALVWRSGIDACLDAAGAAAANESGRDGRR